MTMFKKRYEDTREYKEKMDALKEQDKHMIYFKAGDRVVIKHDLPYTPHMIVQSVDKEALPSDDGIRTVLKGVTCFWFNNFGEIQVHQFNTKDLLKLDI